MMARAKMWNDTGWLDSVLARGAVAIKQPQLHLAGSLCLVACFVAAFDLLKG